MPLSDFYGYIAFLEWKSEQEKAAMESSRSSGGSRSYKVNGRVR